MFNIQMFNEHTARIKKNGDDPNRTKELLRE